MEDACIRYRYVHTVGTGTTSCTKEHCTGTRVLVLVGPSVLFDYDVSVDVKIKIVPSITILQLEAAYDMVRQTLLGFIKYVYCHILITLFKINNGSIVSLLGKIVFYEKNCELRCRKPGTKIGHRSHV